MSDLSGKLGLWCQNTAALQGHLHEVQALGFDYAVVRIVIHPTAGTTAYEPNTLKTLLTNAASMETPFPIQAWAYVYPTHIQEQITAIAAALPPECTDLVLDAEIEWESIAGGAALAHQLAHGIAEAIDHRADLHLSSFCNPNDHPLPYTAFLAHCVSLMPQAYQIGGTPTQTVLGRTLSQSVPIGQQSLGGLTIPTVNTPAMLELVSRHADTFAGANVWVYDTSGSDVGLAGNEDAWTSAIADFHAAYTDATDDSTLADNAAGDLPKNA